MRQLVAGCDRGSLVYEIEVIAELTRSEIDLSFQYHLKGSLAI